MTDYVMWLLRKRRADLLKAAEDLDRQKEAVKRELESIAHELDDKDEGRRP